MRQQFSTRTDLIYMALLTASLQFQFTGNGDQRCFVCRGNLEVPTLNFGEYSIHNDGGCR